MKKMRPEMTAEIANVIKRSKQLISSDRLDTALRVLTAEAKSDVGFVLVYAGLMATNELLLNRARTSEAKNVVKLALAALEKRRSDLEPRFAFPDPQGFLDELQSPTAVRRPRSTRSSAKLDKGRTQEENFTVTFADSAPLDFSVPDTTGDLTPHLKLTPAQSPDRLISVAVYLDTNRFAAGELGEKVSAPDGTEVRVKLVISKHFSAVGPTSASFIFDHKAERIDVAIFHLNKAIVPDGYVTSPAITALFTVNGRPCGKVGRSVTLDGAPLEGVPFVGEALNVEPAVVEQASLTVTITNNPTNDGRQFFCTVSSPHLPEVEPSDWNLPSSAQSLVSGFMKKFTAGSKTSQMIAELVGAGKLLFEAAPENFRQAFWTLVDNKLPLTSIAVVSEESYIPWELMVPTRETATGLEEWSNPIGVDLAVGRWILKVQSPSREISIQGSTVIAPLYTGQNVLENAQKEAELVSKQFKGAIVRPADFEAVSGALVSKSSLLHFVCHGKDQVLDGQAIDLDDGDELTTGNVRGIPGVVASFKSTAPVVFLNACEVGRGNPALVGPGGFAAQFIKLGAKAVIAPLWSVEDSVAHDIAVEFYASLKNDPKTPLANIFSRIRAKAYALESGKDTYAAYCFFGDPLAVLC